MKNNKIGLLACMLGFLSGCDNDPQTLNPQTRDPQKLVMTTSPDNPPFESFDSATRDVVGLDIDLAHLIAAELKLPLEIIQQDFSALIPTVQAGKADFAVAQFSASPERSKAVDFSKPYLKTAGALVVDSQTGITSVQDLKGKTMGVQMGTTFAQVADILKKEIPEMDVKLYNKVTEMVEEVKNGRIHAALLDQTAGAAFAKAHAGLQAIVLDDEVTTQTLSIVLPKGSVHKDAINQAIERLEKSGEMDKLKAKWLTKE